MAWATARDSSSPPSSTGREASIQQGIQHLGPDGEAGVRPVEQSAVSSGEGDAVS